MALKNLVLRKLVGLLTNLAKGLLAYCVQSTQSHELNFSFSAVSVKSTQRD
jgi:hypothetical protein